MSATRPVEARGQVPTPCPRSSDCRLPPWGSEPYARRRGHGSAAGDRGSVERPRHVLRSAWRRSFMVLVSALPQLERPKSSASEAAPHNRDALYQEITHAALPPGLIAYVGDHPVGWTRVGLRSAFPGVRGNGLWRECLPRMTGLGGDVLRLSTQEPWQSSSPGFALISTVVGGLCRCRVEGGREKLSPLCGCHAQGGGAARRVAVRRGGVRGKLARDRSWCPGVRAGASRGVCWSKPKSKRAHVIAG